MGRYSLPQPEAQSERTAEKMQFGWLNCYLALTSQLRLRARILQSFLTAHIFCQLANIEISAKEATGFAECVLPHLKLITLLSTRGPNRLCPGFLTCMQQVIYAFSQPLFF